MTPQTRNSVGAKKSPKLSQLERQSALERGKRVCIVCGKLAPISESVIYPKGRQRRSEFTNALKLPQHVNDALPLGCFICSGHFKSSDIEFSTGGIGSAQISDFAVPCLDLDHEFLNTLRTLDEVEPRSAIRVVKRKLGWDLRPPILTEQENGYGSEESRDSNDDSNELVSTLFANPEFNKKSRKRESLPPRLQQPPLRSVRLVPISEQKLTPPVLEKMADDNDQPPALSPVLRTSRSQRIKALKDLPHLEASTSTQIEDKDLTIKRLRQALKQKTTELDLLKKKLKITEELLQFYQESGDNNECEQAPDLLPHLSECRNSISDDESDQGTKDSPQATAMFVLGNQSGLKQHLEKVLKAENSN